MYEQDSWTEDCLAHDDVLRDGLDSGLNILKGRVILKRLVKRCPYLVCTCKKKHTQLDDVFQNEVSIPHILTKLQTKLSNVISPGPGPDSGDVAKEKISSQTEICAINPDECHSCVEETVVSNDVDETPNEGAAKTPNDGAAKTPNDGAAKPSHDESKCNYVMQFVNNDPLLIVLLDKDTVKSSLTTSQGRLLAIIHCCLNKNIALLEPRDIHKEKVEEIRKLNGRTYFGNNRKAKARKEAKYCYEESIVIDEPHISTAMFVGKRGKNINTINKDKDCMVSVNSIGSKIAIRIRALNAGDRKILRGRVHQVRYYLRQKRQNWELQENQWLAELDMIKPGATKARKSEPMWDIDTEQKESARDEFSKKVSYHISKPRQVPGSKNILDDGARCINCLTPYSKTLLGKSCKYHDGYIGAGWWTCCNSKATCKFSRNLKATKDEQRQSHQNGCKDGRHNFRPIKGNFCRRSPRSSKKR